MKNDFTQSLSRFLKVMMDGQAYLNVLYLVASFPLGLFYFVFLVTGLSLGISTLIVWIGIPILMLVSIGWCAFASFERFIAFHWLKEDFPVLTSSPKKGAGIWTRFKDFATSPSTWKSVVYLFLKLPLGLASFVIVVILVCMTLAFLTAPIAYQLLPDFQAGISFGPVIPAWYIDSMYDALIGTLLGLLLWPLTLQVTNGLAWAHAKFARLMLTNDPMEAFA
jgi:hypothetical protein